MAYQAALSALADPTRREVFEHLRSGPRAVGEIASDMPVSRPAVSQHLKVLKLAGLVADRAEGTRRVYYIDPNGLGALRRWLDQFWDQALVAFQAEVDKAGEPPPAASAKGKTHESHDHGRARPQKRARQRRARTRF
jgi:DNA-binding transcriptional ArsR family regulator